MNIAYFINPSNLKAGGIFTYSIGILNLLIETVEINKIYLIYSRHQFEYLSEYFRNEKIIPVEINRNSGLNNFLLKIYYFLYDISIIYSGYFSESSRLDIFKRVAKFFNPYKKIERLPIKAFHVPAQYSPIYKLKVPVIITMHDVQEFHFPEFFSSSERLHRAINTKKSIEDSDQVIVSFEHIKTDIINFFNVAGEKISICPPPFHKQWFTKDKFTPKEILLNKYNLKEKFILYPAASWPHKNHKILISALKILKEEGLDLQLICTGFKTVYMSELLELINDFKLNDKINFTGVIPEEDLIGLYKLTSLVVIPTLYEAGSGPMYEAMKFGAPVITSNVTSLPDTMNNDDFLFNPVDINSLSQLIKKMITDSEFRERNILNSKKQIDYLSKQDYAKNFIGVYKRLN